MMQTNTLPARSYAGAIRTMIVEDDRASREALTEFLDGEGIPCCAARDAIEALELVAENPAIDVVILDVGLPGFDGFELIQKLAAQRDLNQFKLIVVTGNPTLDAAVKTLRSRAVEFLTKPVDLDRLLDATRRALVTDEAAAPASKNDPPVINADAVYRILIGLRSLGDEILPSGYFHDPAWDVILDLIAAEKRGRPLSLTSVGAVGRGAASQSTLQRRVLQLADQGILDIDLDPRDRRRRLVRLSRKGHNMVDELLLRFGALLTRQSASDRSPR